MKTIKKNTVQSLILEQSQNAVLNYHGDNNFEIDAIIEKRWQKRIRR